MCDKTKKDRIRNESIWEPLGVASSGDKLRDLFEMVWTCPTQANDCVVDERFSMQVDGSPRKMGGLKRTWREVVRIDMKKSNLSEDLGQ